MNLNYELPNCYIYLYHTDEYFIIPQYPDSLQDSLKSTFASQNALSRTAPVFSYSNSGPRSMQITLNLHRDMMNSYNTKGSNVKINMTGDAGNDYVLTSITDDYIDILIKKLQAIALPRFKASQKSINPPRVAIRFGDEIFIKGIVDGGITVTYELPLLENNKYAMVSIVFNVTETTPYDADSVGRLGSFRGLTSGLRAQLEGE